MTEWNHIDWKAMDKITCLLLSDSEDVKEKAWNFLNARSTHPLVDDNIQTWEHGYQAGLPNEGGKYLGLFKREDGSLWVCTIEYDDENSCPLFWYDYDVVQSDNETVFPIAWGKIDVPNMGEVKQWLFLQTTN